MATLAVRGMGSSGRIASSGLGGSGHARRRRMAFALATGVRRNMGYMIILIIPFLF